MARRLRGYGRVVTDVPSSGVPAPPELAPPVEHHHRDVQRRAWRAPRVRRERRPGVERVADPRRRRRRHRGGGRAPRRPRGPHRRRGLDGRRRVRVDEGAARAARARARDRAARAATATRTSRPSSSRRSTWRGASTPTRRASSPTEMMRDPETALETHAREELGIDPRSLGSPWAAAVSSFLALRLGALIPLLPVVLRVGCERESRRSSSRPSPRSSSAACSPASRADRCCSRPPAAARSPPSPPASPSASGCSSGT